MTYILGVLNGTPSAGGADFDVIETPPLPKYSSRQPLSNITKLSGTFVCYIALFYNYLDHLIQNLMPFKCLGMLIMKAFIQETV